MSTKKLTYNYVKNYIAEKSNGECELISDKYINSSSPLALRCKCGNIFYKTFNSLKNNFFICKDCMNKLRSQKYRLDIKDVIEYINNTGCKYISGEYTNNNSLLTIKCKCGNIYTRQFAHFKRGEINCKQCANKKTAQAKMKYNINTLKNIVSQKGYEIIGGEYKTCMTPMDCRCSKGHTFKVKLINALYGNYGCQICQHEYQRGKNHPMYKGGESEVLDNLRKIIKDWKIAIATKYNGKCVLTDTKGDCVVHHIKSFNTLIKETFDELNLPIYRKLKDYTNQQWSDINNLFMKKHTMESGILLQRKVHNKFHSLYGKGNNTYKQFYEFVEKYYPHKLSQFKTD